MLHADVVGRAQLGEFLLSKGIWDPCAYWPSAEVVLRCQ